MAGKKKVTKKAKAKKSSSENAPSKTKKPKKGKRNVTKRETIFPIVGIGASAGGLEALEGFFSHIPAHSGMAFVVVQHLAPNYISIMDSLLKKYTGMIIHQAKDGIKIEPNCIYLNPPDKDMTVMNGTLCLMDPTKPHGSRLPIDCFFRSLAVDQSEMAICVILSGTGSDGTLGLKAIKGEGGIVIVQQEKQARYDNMPKNAIDTGMVDFVLPVEKMGEQLQKYVKHPYIEGVTRPMTSEQRYIDSMRRIFVLIRASTGHDFSNYKLNTTQRRIERRMAVHQISRIEDYVIYLQQNPAEIETLYKDMLIMVTHFFRDADAFNVLEKKVIPALLNNKKSNSPVRVWVPGCGTGEEAYSIAMLLAEGMTRLKKHFPIQIFASDLVPEVIECARGGIYHEAVTADISTERLKQFFTKEDNSYKIKKHIREMVVFAVQNLIKDPPFSKLDIVSCRNVLIYMDTMLHKQILPLFHYVLAPGGYLFLGSSESTGEFSDNFLTVDAKWKIFKRKAIALKYIEYPVIPLRIIETTSEQAQANAKPVEANIRQFAERVIIENYTPPCVLVNEKFEIIYFHGRTEGYLSQQTGEPTFNILKMSRPELRYKLSALLHKAVREKKAVVDENLKIRHNDGFWDLNLQVRPLGGKDDTTGFMMVIFENRTRNKTAAKKKNKKAAEQMVDPYVATLEQELASTKQHLQTTIEELETSNEELRSTNEEMQSTNEELQSTNEELETSREELQSINEELETVNSELHVKVDELTAANNDLNNLFGNTEIGTIFMDTNLCVRRFTPRATEIFSLMEVDIGRPISDINSRVNYKNLHKDAKDVLDTLRVKEVEIQAENGKWFLVRILPYRTLENAIDGLVLTVVDITDRKKMEQVALKEQAEREVREYAESIVATVREPLIVLDEETRVVSANLSFYNIFQVKAEETEGQLLYNLGNRQWDIPGLRKLLDDILPKETTVENFEVQHDFPTIGSMTMLLNARQLIRRDGEKKMILLSIDDITKRRKMEEASEKSKQKSKSRSVQVVR
jgi:two-component system CheB/CheR fusion protein